MPISATQRARHHADFRALLREYFPRADLGAIHDYLAALRAYDLFPTTEGMERLAAAHHLIASSIPTVDLDHEA